MWSAVTRWRGRSVLGPTYAFHGRLLQVGLTSTPRTYSALIWNLVQVLDKRERGTP